MSAIQEMMSQGQTDEHFRILDANETEKVLVQPHCFSFQTTGFKEASKSTKIRHVSNTSNVGVRSGKSLNMCQKLPGNLSNPPDWPLAAFTLYSHPLSADIKSTYHKISVQPDHRRYQLLVLYDFTLKSDWENHPLVCEQVGLPFGCVQSGTYLELILTKVAKTTNIPQAALVMLFFCQVDNFLYSFSTKEALHEIGFKIDKVMTKNNLNLQPPFSTTKQDHYDFEIDHSSEVVLGYQWDKILDLIQPHTVISHIRGTQGRKGILHSEQEFKPEKNDKENCFKCFELFV